MSTPLEDDPATTTPRDSSVSENPLLRASNPLVSDLEQEVLDEYTRLLGNVNKVCSVLSSSKLAQCHPLLSHSSSLQFNPALGKSSRYSNPG